MAKVTMMMTLDIPDIDDHSDAELAQNLFDDVINYAAVAHHSDAIEWMAESKDDIDSAEHIASRHHQLWGHILGYCEWSVIKREN